MTMPKHQMPSSKGNAYNVPVRHKRPRAIPKQKSAGQYRQTVNVYDNQQRSLALVALFVIVIALLAYGLDLLRGT